MGNPHDLPKVRYGSQDATLVLFSACLASWTIEQGSVWGIKKMCFKCYLHMEVLDHCHLTFFFLFLIVQTRKYVFKISLPVIASWLDVCIYYEYMLTFIRRIKAHVGTLPEPCFSAFLLTTGPKAHQRVSHMELWVQKHPPKHTYTYIV